MGSEARPERVELRAGKSYSACPKHEKDEDLVELL